MKTLIEGKYEVLSKIKEGGMGAIYKVRHVLLDEVRVIKVMRPQISDDEESQRRFHREARIATTLKHPNIATMLDFLEDQDHTFYMVMEFIEGVSLAEQLSRQGPPLVPTTLEIAIQSLRALGYLHKRGIVHRDVSPENIMLTHDADGRVVAKLIDLGVAKFAGGEGLTQTGFFVGKVRYSSPEQLGVLDEGEALDGRSDLYSLGCVLYYTLTGRHAFEADTMQGQLMQHLLNPPRPFTESDPEARLPESLRAAILKSLAKRREERWDSAEDFAAALRECQRELLAEVDTGVRALIRENQASVASQRPVSGEHGNFASDERKLAEAFPPSTPSADRLTRITDPGLKTEVAPAFETRAGAAAPVPAVERSVVFLVAAVLVLLLGAAGTIVWKSRHAPPAGTGTVLLTAEPWGRVEKVAREGGGEAVPMNGVVTPARLDLPPGRYRITVRSEALRAEGSVIAEVVTARAVKAHVTMPGFDREGAIRAYAP